jgi:gamma-glutamyltranspeptidase
MTSSEPSTPAAALYHGDVTRGTRWPETRARRGVVASPHHLASEAGVDVFRRGGNAVDAAVAAAAALAVVYPHMNGVGGDNFWLIYDAGRGRLSAVNAAGRSAAAATLDAYRSRFGTAVPARGGPAALTVPGAVSGWWEAHRYSRATMRSPIDWPDLFDAAIHHAREGFPPSSGQRRVTAGAARLFEGGVAAEVATTFWPTFHPDRLAADRFVQPALAETLAIVARDGADAFYRGALGRRIADAAARHGSPLSAEDFAAHTADWIEPLRVAYRGGEAATLPPPTQGVAALAILALIEAFDLPSLDDADYVHIVVEATKLAFEDRDRWLTDPAFEPVPVAEALDRARLDRRRSRITRRAATPAAPAEPVEGDTVAIVAADGRGNAACVIQSLYHEFGSAVVAGETGVLLQNRGAFFSLDPSHPNRLAPRKRTAHTLIPAMYLVGGRPRFVYGTMGGDGQPQTQAALVTRVVDRGFGVQAAVEAPRWLYGRTWGERSNALRVEARLGLDVAESLRQRGHDVHVVDAWSDLMGHAQMIRLDPDGLTAGSDPRADGAALGW